MFPQIRSVSLYFTFFLRIYATQRNNRKISPPAEATRQEGFFMRRASRTTGGDDLRGILRTDGYGIVFAIYCFSNDHGLASLFHLCRS